MPVLIVSEKTCPHDGFSRNRSTRPSSSVTTIPNSSGFSTDLSPIVTAARFSLWMLMLSPKYVSHKAGGGEQPRAGGPQRALLDRVLDAHAEVLPVAEVRPDRLRQERDGHHD